MTRDLFRVGMLSGFQNRFTVHHTVMVEKDSLLETSSIPPILFDGIRFTRIPK